jgi:hypothetical protein
MGRKNRYSQKFSGLVAMNALAVVFWVVTPCVFQENISYLGGHAALEPWGWREHVSAEC